MDTPRGAARRGLLKLMMRMPQRRGELQDLWQRDQTFQALCEAYEDATSTYERLVTRPLPGDADLIDEYRDLCTGLEQDVERRCVGQQSPKQA
ncbi:hypothetical protein [Rhizobium sp. ZW T2_16]|uniref:hypothetical protein n=1 Tax=Rhizobium sp. ZW T2_16 TaxID=3378083 RepID=UPI00385461B1